METPTSSLDCQTAFASYRDVLAELYEDTDSARRVTDDAGIDASHVSFTAHATNTWHAILTEAEKENRLHALFDVVCNEYGANQALNQAWADLCNVYLDDPGPLSLLRMESVPLTPPLAAMAGPYRGLLPFEAKHAEYYFGREAMVEKLVTKVGQASFVAVVGPSGCGKSSLVRAGLIVALQQDALPDSAEWPLAIFRPGDDPLCAMVSALPNLLGEEKSLADCLAEQRKMADSLLERVVPVKDLLAELRRQHPESLRLLLVVDQFEEIFTLCRDEKIRKMFLSALVDAAATPWITVLITLRAGFYGDVLAEESLGTLVDAGLFNVLPMSEEERRAAIEQPALNAGRRFEEGLVDRILDAVADEPGELPLMEFALTELWDHQTEDGLLTHDAYELIGEVEGAIARRAEQTFDSYNFDERAEVRSIFTRLVRVARPQEGAKDTRRRIDLDELNPTAQALVRSLADTRLLVTDRDQDTDEVAVEISHEALIRSWQRLQLWLDTDREFLLWRDRLRALADSWITSGRDEGALLRGALLAEGENWMAQRKAEMTELEQEFITDSQAIAEREQAALEAARQRELKAAQDLAVEAEARAEAEATARNRLRWVAVIGVALLLVVIVFFLSTNQRKVQLETANTELDVVNMKLQEANTDLDLVNVELQGAVATAESNVSLAQDQLDFLKGESLLSEAYGFVDKLEADQAIEIWKLAVKAEPSLLKRTDASSFISDTLRYVATQLVEQGEVLARKGDSEDAGQKFREALALNPPSDTPVYVWIEEGSFLMGSNDSDVLALDNEKPQRSQDANGFWIMRTEVTNAQYGRCVDAKVCSPPLNPRWNQPQYVKHPVSDVTWLQAQSYAEWVGGRLPTEAEWEKACRGTDGGIYPWGDVEPVSEALNYAGELGIWTNVGTYPSGAHGLYDMAGNVWEWTFSEWGDDADAPGYAYPNHATDGQEIGDTTKGEFRAIRGGSLFYKDKDELVRCAYRGRLPANYQWGYLGFRVLIPGP